MRKTLFITLLLLATLPTLALETLFKTSLAESPEALKSAGWKVPAKGVSSVDGALQIEATGGERNYMLYYFPVETGAMYGGSIKVKPLGVAKRNNSDRGATLFFGFADKEKKWIAGGEFPRGGYDTGDWREVGIGMTQPIPANVAFIEVWVCVEGQGTAQFKELEIHKVDLTTKWSVDASSNPPTFTFDSPPFLNSQRIRPVLRITLSQSPDFPPNASFVEIVHATDRFTVPHSLAPGKWYAKGNWCGRTVFPDMLAEFSYPTLPEVITYKVTPTFANGVFNSTPRLSFTFYPKRPQNVTVTIQGEALEITAQNDREITFGAKKPLAAGNYDIIVTADGKPSKHLLVNKNPAHTFAFRDDKMLLIDDKPFFPIGTYRDPSDDRNNFDGIHEAGFNVTHCYAFEDAKTNHQNIIDYLEACHRNGVYAFMGIPRNLLKEDNAYAIQKHCAVMYDQPSLLSFYLADEPELWINQFSMKNGADTVKAACPFVPRILLLCQANETSPIVRYLANGLSDILWHDPYPIPQVDISSVKTDMLKIRKASNDSQPLWGVIQAFDWKQQGVKGMKYEEIEPKAGKIRCMTHLALAANAQGIIYYWLPRSRYDMRRDSPIQWAETVACARELHTLYPYLTGRNAPQDIKLPQGVDYWCRQAANGQFALGLINTTDAPIDCEINILSFKQKVNLRPWGVEVLK